MSTSGDPADAHAHARHVRLFPLWENADLRVPFKGLYSVVARPAQHEALKLEDLGHCTFVYRVTDAFVAELEFAAGAFGPATLRAQSFTYKLTSIPGRYGLMPPGDAETLLDLHLGQKERKFWNDFLFEIAPELTVEVEVAETFSVEHFRRLHWHSLRLEQPFGAGFGEPFYKFRKRGSRHEFWVGARSGEVRDERARDDFPSVPQPPLP